MLPGVCWAEAFAIRRLQALSATDLTLAAGARDDFGASQLLGQSGVWIWYVGDVLVGLVGRRRRFHSSFGRLVVFKVGDLLLSTCS